MNGVINIMFLINPATLTSFHADRQAAASLINLSVLDLDRLK